MDLSSSRPSLVVSGPADFGLDLCQVEPVYAKLGSLLLQPRDRQLGTRSAYSLQQFGEATQSLLSNPRGRRQVGDSADQPRHVGIERSQ